MMLLDILASERRARGEYKNSSIRVQKWHRRKVPCDCWRENEEAIHHIPQKVQMYLQGWTEKTNVGN